MKIADSLAQLIGAIRGQTAAPAEDSDGPVFSVETEDQTAESSDIELPIAQIDLAEQVPSPMTSPEHEVQAAEVAETSKISVVEETNSEDGEKLSEIVINKRKKTVAESVFEASFSSSGSPSGQKETGNSSIVDRISRKQGDKPVGVPENGENQARSNAVLNVSSPQTHISVSESEASVQKGAVPKTPDNVTPGPLVSNGNEAANRPGSDVLPDAKLLKEDVSNSTEPRTSIKEASGTARVVKPAEPVAQEGDAEQSLDIPKRQKAAPKEGRVQPAPLPGTNANRASGDSQSAISPSQLDPARPKPPDPEPNMDGAAAPQPDGKPNALQVEHKRPYRPVPQSEVSMGQPTVIGETFPTSPKPQPKTTPVAALSTSVSAEMTAPSVDNAKKTTPQIVPEIPFEAGLGAAQSGPTSGKELVKEPPPLQVTLSRPAEAARDIAVQIKEVAATTEARQIEIRLSPEELGKVRISLTGHENGGSVSIMVERPETLELMRRHSDQLLREFRAAGWADVDLSMSQQDMAGQSGSAGTQNHDAPNRPGEGYGEGRRAQIDTVDPPVASRALPVASDRLDVRI